MHVILVLSNGYGEDLVGARIASELRRALPGREVVGFPWSAHLALIGARV